MSIELTNQQIHSLRPRHLGSVTPKYSGTPSGNRTHLSSVKG